jgi:hypothetical protein
MPNYLKRGFKPFKKESYTTTLSPEELREKTERAVRPAAT